MKITVTEAYGVFPVELLRLGNDGAVFVQTSKKLFDFYCHYSYDGGNDLSC